MLIRALKSKNSIFDFPINLQKKNMRNTLYIIYACFNRPLIDFVYTIIYLQNKNNTVYMSL